MSKSTLEYLTNLTGLESVTIPELVAARVKKSPNHTFVNFEGESWSYEEAWAEVKRFGGFIESLGISGQGCRVASYLTNCPEVYWTWFGTQFMGAPYVSLNRDQKGIVLEDMLRRSKANILVTQKSAVDNLPDMKKVGVDHVVFVDGVLEGFSSSAKLYDFSDVAETHPSKGVDVKPSDVATIMFTSGTTGRSKAVLIPHNMLTRGAARLAQTKAITSKDIFYLWEPLFHISGQLHATLSMIIGGGTIALYPKFSLSRFWSQIRESNATIFEGFETVMHLILSLPESKDDKDHGLRLASISPIPEAEGKTFTNRFNIPLIDTYGMTEVEPLTLCTEKDDLPPTSAGKINPDFEIEIHDLDGKKVEVGKAGEIVVKVKVPDVMFKGYEEDEEATVKAWYDGWFHTGDLGRMDENGYLFFVDRMKHSIRRRGENVSSYEAEKILRTHSEIDDCAVIGVPSLMGEEDVKTCIVLNSKNSHTPQEIHAFCKKNMPRFMVPRFIEFHEKLPYSEVGKVQKEELRINLPDVWDAEVYSPENKIYI